MIECLRLRNVGPAPRMEMELAPRLNLITGDNGLGKSFLLDVIWWALTRKWPQEVNPHMNAGYAARPRRRARTRLSGFVREERAPQPSTRLDTYRGIKRGWGLPDGRCCRAW